jgi:hypothetical protein
MNNEIVIYQSEILSSHIEVRIEDETVWLSQLQMVDLFQSTKQNINLHINNVFKEGELDEISTVKEYLTVRQEGHRIVKRKVKLYSLDVIISVGYRVKSKTGTQFRIWATNTLKTYLLKGYVVQDRIERIEKRLYEHDTKIKLLLNTNLSPNQGIFYDGQVFDAYEFASKIIKSAKKSIIVIDNYIDESVLMLLSKRESKVKATVYTDKITIALQADIEKYNEQYAAIEFAVFKKAHDRFLIVDQKEIYHLGASLKDLGKKWFAFSKLNIDPKELIEKIQKRI